MAITKAKLIADGVITVDNLNASHGITTTHIGEGEKLFYTDGRVSSYLTSNNYTTLAGGYFYDATLSTNILTFSKSDGTTDSVDLSLYLDDTNLARLVSGTLDALTGIATFTRDDSSTFTIDFSAFLSDANDYVSSGSFNTTTGVLTLTRLGGGTVTVDLDGKYAEASHTHLWAHITDRPTALSAFTNDLGNYGGFLTSFTETDPVYVASSWYTTTNNASNWNTAYDWGNHADGGYQAATTAITTSNIGSQSVNYANTAGSTSYLSALDPYVWNASTNGRDFNRGIQTSFVRAEVDGYPSYGSVVRVRSYTSSEDGGTAELYFPYSSNYGGPSMRYRLGQYNNAGWTGWKTVIDSDNIGSQSVNYAISAGTATDSSKLPLTGGTLTGTLAMHAGAYYGTITFGSTSYWRTGISQRDAGNAELRIWAKGGGAGSIYFATNFDGESGSAVLPADGMALKNNNLGIGGWGVSEFPSYKLHVKGAGYATDDFRAPIFYDSNDTTYYLDPNSSPSLFSNGVVVAGNQGFQSRYYAGGRNRIWSFYNSDNFGISYFQGGPDYIGLHFGTATQAGSQFWASENGIAQASASLRAPIFYDSNNTGYYVDPASTSSLNAVNVSSLNGFSPSNFGYFRISNGYFDNGTTTDNFIGDLGDNGHLSNGFTVSKVPWSYAGNSDVNTGIQTIEMAGSAVTTWHDGSYYTSLVIRPTTGTGGGSVYIYNNQGSDYAPGWRQVWTSSTDAYNYASTRSPVHYDVSNTAYYVDPDSTSNFSDASFGAGAGSGNQGMQISYGNYAGGYGRIRFYQDGSNHQTIHSFSNSWQNGTLQSASSGAINIAGFSGVTFGGWNNPDMWIDSDGNSQSRGSSRAPIFYDSNNTSYYCDPNNLSRFDRVDPNEIYNYGWFRSHVSGNGVYNQATGQHFYSDSGSYWNMGGGGINGQGIRFRDNHGSTIRGYVYYDQSNNIGFLNQDGNWRLRVVGGDYSLADGSSMRAQIFYDSTNTGYYLDAASTSNLAGLYVANTINGSVSARSAYSGYLETAYAGGQQLNPQTYFNSGVGVKVAMTASWGYWSDTLWINGYAGGDVLQMCALHTQRNGTPRIAISVQASTSTSYGTLYELWSSYNMDAPNKSGTSYYQANTWMQFNGGYGLYWPSQYNAHFYPNDFNSHTQFRLSGSKNGYGGIVDSYSAVNGMMYDSDGNGGVYREANGRWYFYHHLGNNCTGINGSTTSSAYGLYVQKGIYSTDDIVAYSDVRKKTNIETIDSALDKVTKLRGVYYDRIDDLERGRQIGVIAQEVNEVLPEAVTYAEDVDEYGVKYGNIVGVLIEAIKEQQKQIEELKAIVNGLTK